jgi:hypothetical protein
MAQSSVPAPPVQDLSPRMMDLDKRFEEEWLRRSRHDQETQQHQAEGRFSPDIPVFEQTLKERRKSLADVGALFEFNLSGSLTIANIGCLIGENGNVYTYDLLTHAGFQTENAMSARDYRRAVGLAGSLDQQQFNPRRVRYDSGVASWTVSLSGVTTVLKLAGEYEWAIPGEGTTELVKLIDEWCPIAKVYSTQSSRSK